MVGPPDSEMIPIDKKAGYSQVWEEGLCHTVGPHGEVPGWTRRQRERANAGENLYVYLQEAEWAGLGLSSLNNSSDLWALIVWYLLWGEPHRGGIGVRAPDWLVCICKVFP